jgi:hypothetical protein
MYRAKNGLAHKMPFKKDLQKMCCGKPPPDSRGCFILQHRRATVYIGRECCLANERQFYDRV